MKKTALALLIAIILGVLVYSQRGLLAQRIMSVGAEAAMSTNYIDNLEDGLHVVLCGAGGPLPDPARSGPCVAIIAGKQFFVVDAGTNGLRNLVRMRLPVGDIKAVLLTHFHSDHIDGLGEMATIRWVNGGNKRQLPVIGPKGVEHVIQGFNQAYEQDAVYRNEHHGEMVAPLDGFGLQAQSFNLPAKRELTTVYEDGGLTIRALLVDHAPVSPAVGYLFNYKGRSVLISGDTDKSENVEHFAEGVDVLVHEALAENLVGIMHDTARKVGNPGLAKITLDILNYHATPVEAAEIARDAGVGHLLYYHIVPPLILPGMEAAWLEGVDEVFRDYTLGQDGTTVSMPAGSEAIIVSRERL